MNSQKVNFIPTVNGVPITNYTPVSEEISLDVIDMPEANKAWSMQIDTIKLGGGYMCEILIFAGNSLDLDFVQYMDPIFIPDDTPIIISEPEFNYRYMFLKLAFSEVESISISMVK